MITLKIDGKPVEIEKGATILAAAEKLGIRIPTLCFLKKVSPTGACRICVVDVAGAEKPMAACHTVAEEGMEVTTGSERLYAIRKQLIELLLVNHPLDCPVCDAAGECELQNICYEHDVTRQDFCAEDVNPAPITGWPLIEQVPNRCVMCEKCVKVCHETIGADALFVNDKGDRAFIDKDLAKCVFCGNCVQVCPTGTMISKPFKFAARCWELTKVASTCTSCGSQCQIDLNVKNNRVYRVTADDATTINQGTLCFNGFFGFDYVHAPQRLTTPLLRDSRSPQRKADWDEAIGRAAEALRNAGSAAAGIAGIRLTNEEGYLFQTIFRSVLKSGNFDSETRFGALRAYRVLQRQLGMKGGTARLDRIARAAAILVIGADPAAEAPAVDWQIQKGSRKLDAKLVTINACGIRLDACANVPVRCRPGSEGLIAAAIARSILDQGLADAGWLGHHLKNEAELRNWLAGIDIAAIAAQCGVAQGLIEEAARLVGEAGSLAVVFGGAVCCDSQAESTLGAIVNLALVGGAFSEDAGGLFPIGSGGNSQGLFDMGVAFDVLPGGDFAPAAQGRNLQEILVGIESGAITTLYLAGANPLTFAEGERWRKGLEKLDCLIVQDILASEATALAHVVLPGASFAEKNGTVTSSGHRTSDLARAIAPCGNARSDADILGALLARLAPAQALTSAALRSEVLRYSAKATYVPAPATLAAAAVGFAPPCDGMVLVAGKDLYYAAPTNAYSAASKTVVPGGYFELNPADAARLGLQAGDQATVGSALGSVRGPVRLSADVPAGTVFAPLNCPDLKVQALLPCGCNVLTVQIAKG